MQRSQVYTGRTLAISGDGCAQSARRIGLDIGIELLVKVLDARQLRTNQRFASQRSRLQYLLQLGNAVGSNSIHDAHMFNLARFCARVKSAFQARATALKEGRR